MTAGPRRVHCLTLGCDKNLVDSEALMGAFGRAGCVPAPLEDAEIWVLNTCGFIEAARRDSRDLLEELAAAKGAGRVFAVVGCWAQEHADEIRRDYPEVDVIAGVGEFDRVVAACRDPRLAAGPVDPAVAAYEGLGTRTLLTPAHVAFVKIGEGCDCACTYCRIPLIRGPLRSRPVDEIVAEVRRLAAGGVREIQLVSQSTASYGRDLGTDLVTLVRALDRIDGLAWIRLLYLYPGLVAADDLLGLLELERVVPYLDLPVQHASERLLRAMRRPGDVARMEDFFETLRGARPELVLRTTVLLGFPGERDEDVEELADFLARIAFDHLGTYRYSPEAGTPAAALPRRIPDEVVADREALILDLQAEISLARQRARLGERHQVVVDGPLAADEARELLAGLADAAPAEYPEQAALREVLEAGAPVAAGRSWHYGYDLDGIVVLPGAGLAPGRLVRARFAAVTAHDTWAVPG
jgi:ribosomal protein S12 methylthiotransferase